VLLGGVRLEACEIVEEAQCLGVESSGLKPLVKLGDLGAVSPVVRVLVTGVLRAPPADRVCDGEIKRQARTVTNESLRSL
jgi:hypothetical protein